ncbi:MAG TPA: 1,2-phenylacetyl-CoA epoxidase subunit PaaE, partial [Hanamia sp.]|nr:1,2-phenylacetyl-CoA epoxidase subunit PaaE [Hanamia sp.]
MSIHFHPLKVKDVRKETDECVSIAFEIAPEAEQDFRFVPGQNITVRKFFDGQEIRRSYSICSSTFENELRVAVKKVADGIFSTFANEQLQIGDVLEVLPPTGNFYTPIVASQKKNYVFIAAGSGITPVISLIKTILATEKESNVTLLYGNKGLATVIFKEQLEVLKDKYLQRFNIHHVLSREKTDTDFNSGRIDASKLKLLSRLIDFNLIDDFFICGPEPLIFTVKDFLLSRGIDPDKIHFELFTTPTKEPNKVFKEIKQAEEEGSDITMRIDGRSFQFKLDYNGKSILDAGLDHGADLPFACKGGVCCTCKAKLIEGEVDMEANYGLEKSELKAGYILTCQSHPRTEKVVV